MSSQRKTPPNLARKGPSHPVKYYLIAYNILSALGWSYVLITTVLHLGGYTSSSTPSRTAASTLSSLLSHIPFLRSAAPAHAQLAAHIPAWLQPVYTRATTAYGAVGPATALVQSAALLEVLHAAVGWVRSPLQTTAMQVASRLFLVWGVVELSPVARASPLYASMVFAWSLTEVIRYTFYAAGLMGHEPRVLVWLRYTTFFVLYPLGAGSEAFVNFATLPAWTGKWTAADVGRAVLFVIWWPGLYVMYSYMMKQRRKVLGSGVGHKIGAKPKNL